MKTQTPLHKCLECGNSTYNPKFCSRSCSATYSNKRKDYSKFKPGPPKGTGALPPHTKIKRCSICNKYHPGKRQTCSEECYKKLMSIKTNKRIDLGWNPQEHRNRSTLSFLEQSFETWLTINSITNYIKNKTFRCSKKVYYGDFYFPGLHLLIELDGAQHKQNEEYDDQRDTDILKHHKIYTIRISYKEYMAKTKYELITYLLTEFN